MSESIALPMQGGMSAAIAFEESERDLLIYVAKRFISGEWSGDVKITATVYPDGDSNEPLHSQIARFGMTKEQAEIALAELEAGR